jgi:hypothetical protein
VASTAKESKKGSAVTEEHGKGKATGAMAQHVASAGRTYRRRRRGSVGRGGGGRGWVGRRARSSLVQWFSRVSRPPRARVPRVVPGVGLCRGVVLDVDLLHLHPRRHYFLLRRGRRREAARRLLRTTD